MATMNHHCYEQSASSWHREWAGDDSHMEEMTDEEREEAENAARVEIERSLDEEAWYREQERRDMHLSPYANMTFDDNDAPF